MNLKICWLVIWLVASNPMTKSREIVTTGWTVYFRYRTQESGKTHNERVGSFLVILCDPNMH